MELLNEVKERLSIFKNLYDSLRIVDPLNKKVITVNEDKTMHTGEACYSYWNKNRLCENCISIRAYMQNDTCVKIVSRNKNIILTIAVPVIYKGQTYILEMLKDISRNSSNLGDLNDGIGNVNLLLEEMGNKIIRDDLTGVYNRRYITERLPVDINKCAIAETPLSIIMADIDYFKNVNDTYGHVIGDRVLKDFAALISENINHETSWMARYGGEEFIIVLINTDMQTAYDVAEEMRKKLEKKVFKYEDLEIKITSSFGVYSVDNRKIEVEDLISQVDKNLYKAKQSGRNVTIK